MPTNKVTLKEHNFELERKLRKIVDDNCEEVPYEGTEVNRNQIVKEIIEFFADKNNHYSLLKHSKL